MHLTNHQRHQLFLIVVCLSLFIGCTTTTKQVATVSSAWPLSTPTAEGVDPQMVESIHQDITAGKYGLIDHFLLIRHGKIIADHHYTQDYETIAAKYDTTNHQYNYDHPEWHPYYKNSQLHSLQSVTKSVTSALLGIAIDEGKLAGVDQKVMPLFKDYNVDLSDERKRSITLEDLLTMRSGIEWNEGSYSNADNSCILMEASDNWIQFVLDHPMDTVPGVVFEYNSGVSVLLGKLVRIATGKRIDKWAEEKLFKPLGITDYYWKVTPQGEIDTEGGLYLSAHDLAKIGYLFLHKGQWKGQQIISKAWVEKSTSPIVTHVNPDNSRSNGYGYQWWIQNNGPDATPIFAGNGYGWQFVMVAPEYDMVVVFNGWNIHDQPEKFTWNTLYRTIIPASKL
ncbi:MAG: hypothetical protein DHS20C18_32330 [Saprospiraceae bacterium]|nr:MAG: hypothetical protein DHS20C18_32330 [Saprospiraceae bacterium]